MKDRLFRSCHLTFIFIAALTVFIFFCSSSAAEDSVIKEYGSIGDGVSAYLMSDGTLKIVAEEGGTGKISDFGFSTSKRPPYYADRGNITAIDIGVGVRQIGAYAFADLGEVDFISIPDTISYIGISAFRNVDKNSVIYGGNIEGYLAIEIANKESCPISGADEFVVGGNDLTELVIPSSVSEIGKYSFIGYDGFTSLALHTGITKLHRDLFINSQSITSLTIPAESDYYMNFNTSLITSLTLVSDTPEFTIDGELIDAYHNAEIRVKASGISLPVSSLSLSEADLNVKAQRREGDGVTVYEATVLGGPNTLDFAGNAEIYYEFTPGLDEKNIEITYSGDHTAITYDSDSGIITVIASELGELTVGAPSEDNPTDEGIKIRSAYLNITESIHMIFVVDIPEGYSSAVMTISFLGEQYTVIPTPREGGGYECRFSEIMPYQMNDTLDATLIATDDNGEDVTAFCKGMSIRKYSEMVYEQYSDDTDSIALLSSLLIYGKECQKYRKYKTDALVTDGIDWLVRTEECEYENNYSIIFDNADDRFVGAGLYLSDTVGMFFTVKNKTPGIKVLVSVNDRIEEYDLSSMECDDFGRYVITYSGLMAHEISEEVVAKLVTEDGQTVSILTYSVGSYALATKGEDESLDSLILALTTYGTRAREYKERR